MRVTSAESTELFVGPPDAPLKLVRVTYAGGTKPTPIRVEGDDLHTPTPHTEYGVKGMGEGGAIAPPAAIANAVRDALAPLGAEVNETPLTPRRVLAAIREAQRQSSRD